MINLHESMGPGRDRTRDPWICSQTRICCQTRYRLRYVAQYFSIGILGKVWYLIVSIPDLCTLTYFDLTDRSKAVLLLWIFYVFVLSCVCYVFVGVYLYVLCGHLLTSWLSFVVSAVSLSLSHWYPGSGVVLDCIDCTLTYFEVKVYVDIQIGRK